MPCFFTVISFASFSLSLVICQEGSDFCFSFCLYFSLPLFWFTFISMIKNNDQKQHEKKVYFGYYSQVTLLSLREIKARTPKFSDREKDAIRERISQGIPVRRIAEEFRCSAGYVQKLKCEHLL